MVSSTAIKNTYNTVIMTDAPHCAKSWWIVLLAGMCLFPLSSKGITTLDFAAMPGPVIQGHAKYEKDCKKCHSPFAKEEQNRLCLDCHKEVRADVNQKEGFHGKMRDIKTRQCKTCHTDHKGRNFKIVLLDESTFNHDQTDFPLKASHRFVPCGACHKPKKKHREAPAKCYDCHKQDEPHKGKLGKKCEICHSEVKWTDFLFDHSKTDFPLKGKHIGVNCQDCHVNERYKGIPVKCYACHRSDDKHKGQYGRKCDNCHREQGWYSIKFDHDQDTDFKLEGGHVQVTCGQCHKGEDIYNEDLSTECVDCHKFKDEHKGLYGKKCHDCHTPKSWQEIEFDHNEDTDWPLRGKHEDVACQDCHSGNLYEDDAPEECYGCHRQDDVHNGQEGKECDECHSEEGWIKQVEFDHDITKFPLLGAHATVGCEECHATTNFKDVKKECVSCHEADDVHEKRLGPKCETCHNSTDFLLWLFDHDKQTDFILDGKHENLHCDLCHKEPVEDEFDIDPACVRCHTKDDIHNGSYGRLCDRCHVTSSFADFSPEWR